MKLEGPTEMASFSDGTYTGGERDPLGRGDHPCPVDPVAETSDLRTTGDLAESGSRPAVSLRSTSTFSQLA